MHYAMRLCELGQYITVVIGGKELGGGNLIYPITKFCPAQSDISRNAVTTGLAPWRSGIAPESIGGVYGHNAMGSNPSANPPV